MGTTIKATKKSVLIKMPIELDAQLAELAASRYQAKTVLIIELLRLQLHRETQGTPKPYDGVQKR